MSGPPPPVRCVAWPATRHTERSAGVRGLQRDDVDDLAPTLRAELDVARDEREQRVVAATADAVTGVEVRAALADEDLARVDELAAEALDAE